MPNAARNGSAAGLSDHNNHNGGGDAQDADGNNNYALITSPADSNYAYGAKSPSSVCPPSGVRSTNSERNLQAKKRVVFMLIIVVFEFFICFTPIWLVNIINFFDPQGIHDHVGGIGITYLQLLMYISTCCKCREHTKLLTKTLSTTKTLVHRLIDWLIDWLKIE